MAFDFPSSPTVGQQFTPVAGTTYTYNGYGWALSVVLGAGQLKKNYIINGAMMISQENGATAGTVSGYYPADQFPLGFSNAGAVSMAQVASATPAGSPNRIRVTVTTADASVGATDFSNVQQSIEGVRVADLRFGSAVAKTITIQFGVKAPAGTYCVSIVNNAGNRSYVAEYVIAAGEANTDVVKSVTIPGETIGPWLVDNGLGFSLRWGLMCGANFQQLPGGWGTINTVGSLSQFNFMGTVGNVFELFDVGLYEGTVAPAFQVPDYASELALCKRYFYNGAPPMVGIAYSSTIISTAQVLHPVQMRAVPTLTIVAALTVNFGGTGWGTTTATSISSNISTTTVLKADLNSSSLIAGGVVQVIGGNLNVNARL